MAATIGNELNSITDREHNDVHADWHSAGDNLLTAIVVGPGGSLYRLVVEPLPDRAGWDWTVWCPDEPPKKSRYGHARDRAAAIAAAEDQLRTWPVAESHSHAKTEQRELAMLEEFERCLDMPRLNRRAKQGEDSFTGDRIVRRVTLHWQGSNRGAWTSTVPNNDRSCRGRRSFSGCCSPHRGQRRRTWQCSSACV